MSRRLSMMLGLTALVAGCGGTRDATDAATVQATVGGATMSVPKGWTLRLPATETERQVWSPDPPANAAKETLAIRVAPRRERMSDDEILAAATTAQQLLPGLEVVERHALMTRLGMKALWIETSFQPQGSSTTYHRAHITAIGRSHVFHVFYTAATPDPKLQVLRDAIDSLKEEV